MICEWGCEMNRDTQRALASLEHNIAVSEHTSYGEVTRIAGL